MSCKACVLGFKYIDHSCVHNRLARVCCDNPNHTHAHCFGMERIEIDTRNGQTLWIIHRALGVRTIKWHFKLLKIDSEYFRKE